MFGTNCYFVHKKNLILLGHLYVTTFVMIHLNQEKKYLSCTAGTLIKEFTYIFHTAVHQIPYFLRL